MRSDGLSGATSILTCILGLASGLVLAFNLALAARWVFRRHARHISGIPLLGGIGVAVVMLWWGEPLRAWAWVPLVADPWGVLPLLIGLWRSWRGPTRTDRN